MARLAPFRHNGLKHFDLSTKHLACTQLDFESLIRSLLREPGVAWESSAAKRFRAFEISEFSRGY
jgi:hypothetical protein